MNIRSGQRTWQVGPGVQYGHEWSMAGRRRRSFRSDGGRHAHHDAE
ncbi:hypothetical protein [Burkholderia pyrrocinia]|uniref:Uncharacterized protein n=1 Tax=Burkholderia pyrrocinia TaxID=60550 RepID=A0ABZ3BKZ5_BURPY